MDDRQPVALVRCDSYKIDVVEAALARGLDQLGGMEAFVSAGQHVVLKPNLVRAMDPDQAATTHPALVAAVIRAVRAVGAEVLVVDSPGGLFTPGILKSLYRKTGMDWAVREAGGTLNLDVATTQMPVEDGRALHRIDIVEAIANADAIINLPKLKTHNLTGLTLSVKNLFGVVPGTLKIAYHGKMQDSEQFSQGLLDILSCTRPVLNIMDAIIAMEGNGPSGGDPREIDALILGADALAVDVVAASLVGLDPVDVTTTAAGVHRGWTTGRLEDIDLRGDSVSTLSVSEFRQGTNHSFDPGLLPGFLRQLLPRRDIDEEERGRVRSWSSRWLTTQLLAYPEAGAKCTGCGYCARNCPVQAITIKDGRAHMDLHRCIRCYACHELCPELAIDLKRPWLARVLDRI
ncbi:MAG: DUF362 domain-containing protein [Anaerolineae bacterium]|nr:DUF362 domain-containing protein [Anaerolineae bacterium]